MVQLEGALAGVAFPASFEGEVSVAVAILPDEPIGPLRHDDAVVVVVPQLDLGRRQLQSVHLRLELVLHGDVGLQQIARVLPLRERGAVELVVLDDGVALRGRQLVVEGDRLQGLCPEIHLGVVGALQDNLTRLCDDVYEEGGRRLGVDFDAILQRHDARVLISLAIGDLEPFESLAGAGEKHHEAFLKQERREEKRKNS